MKQKIKIGDLQRLLPFMQAFVRDRQRRLSTTKAKGVIGTLTFIKRLSRMRHDADLSEWEPILKRRLIRLLHQFEGYNGHPGFLFRAYGGRLHQPGVAEDLAQMQQTMSFVCLHAHTILKRLADVDGVSGSLLKMPT